MQVCEAAREKNNFYEAALRESGRRKLHVKSEIRVSESKGRGPKYLYCPRARCFMQPRMHNIYFLSNFNGFNVGKDVGCVISRVSYLSIFSFCF